VPNVDRVGHLNVPNLPSLAKTETAIINNIDNGNNHDDNDDNGGQSPNCVKPVNIAALKEYVAKKLQADAARKLAAMNSSSISGGQTSLGLGRAVSTYKGSQLLSRNNFSIQSNILSLTKF